MNVTYLIIGLKTLFRDDFLSFVNSFLISSLFESSGLSLVWLRNDHNPRLVPCGPPPGRLLVLEMTPCHLTNIFLFSKKLMRMGMRQLLTPLSWKLLIANVASVLSNALDQSHRVAMTAVCSPLVEPSRTLNSYQ